MLRISLLLALLAVCACGSAQGGAATDASGGKLDSGALADSQDTVDAILAVDATPQDTVDAQPLDSLDAAPDVSPDVPADVPPDATADAPVDGSDAADSVDAATPPKACFQPYDCGPGTSCISAPCKNCGAKPAGLCLPPVTGQGCWFYPDCSGGLCHGANAFQGVQGFCLPKPDVAGACWPDSAAALPQCLPGSACEGGTICPPMGACPSASKPGVCSAGTEQKGKVFLWARNGGLVAPGETVIATWVNATDKSIFLGGCGTYLGETTKDGTSWSQAGAGIVCVWEGLAQEVLPGGYRDVETWTSPANVMSGTFRLHGQWFTGCTPGKPVSQGGCSAPNEAMSETFSVGLAP